MNNSKVSYKEFKDKYICEFKNNHDFITAINYIKNKPSMPFSQIYFTNDDEKILKKIIKQYRKNIPLPYILNEVFFYKSYFIIKSGVFIPRQDSEAMIEDIISSNQNVKNVCEFFCGSGALGLSVFKELNLNKLTLIDISKKALKIAKLNVFKENIFIKKVKFEKIFVKYIYNSELIILNPPYIDIKDKEVSESARSYEPKKALFAKNHGLYFFQKLFEIIVNCKDINEKLKIYCEFGYKQKDDISAIIPRNMKATFKKDYQGNWRYFILEKQDES